MSIKKLEPGKWQLNFRPGGTASKQVKRIFPTKTEAERFRNETLRQHRAGLAVDDKAARSTTVGALWSAFREHVAQYGVRGNRPAAPKTLSNYDFKYRHYIEPSWQYTPVASVTRERCREWIDSMTTANGDAATDDGKREAAGAFTRVLDYGIEQGLLESNPMKTRAGKPLPMPPAPDSRANVYMTPRQLSRLADLSGAQRLMILTAGTTGLRWNEIAGLVAGEVELGSRPSVHVPKSRSKTNEPRTIQLPRQVADALRVAGVTERASDAPVFPAARGGHWSYPYFMKKFRPVAGRAASAIQVLQDALGVTGEHERLSHGGESVTVARFGQRTLDAVRQWQDANGHDVTGVVAAPMWDALGLPDLSPVTLSPTAEDGGDDQHDDRDMPAQPTFHDLRHTAVSLGIQAGLNIKLVQQMAGHMTASMTLDTYGHLYPEDVGKAAQAMTEVLGTAL